MRSPLVRWITTSTRVLVGGAVAVATVLAVVVAVAFPWPTVTAAPVQVRTTPAPSDTELACDGPLLALGRVVEQAGALSVAAAQTVVSGPEDVDARQDVLSAPADGQPLIFTAPPEGSAPAAFAAAGSSATESADLRGFAASACRPPLLESWLVGGATTTGSNDLVVLANPGSVAATVQLTVYGASGAVTAPGGTDRVVPAGQQVVVPLSGLLPAEASPVVRVSATGAPVTASLQSSLVRTLVPGGVDQVGPVAAAAARQVIPGVSVVAPEPGAQGAGTILRALSPAMDAQAEVTVRGADGSVVGETLTLPLAAGIPTELELAGLTPGRYAVTVLADVPVVAGVWSTTGLAEGSDFAWYAAAPEISAASVFAVPPGPGAALTIAAGATGATIALTGPDGATRELSVPPGAVGVEGLAAAGVYTFAPDAPVRASVSFQGGGALAGYPVWGVDAAAPPLVVFP